MISNACCASAWQESISNRINSQRFIIVSYRNRLRAYFSRFHLQRHCSEGCSARRGLRRVVILHKQAATLQCAHRTVALRVDAGRDVCGVASLANGTTIGCALRLASIRVQHQSGDEAYWNRLLGYFPGTTVAPMPSALSFSRAASASALVLNGPTCSLVSVCEGIPCSASLACNCLAFSMSVNTPTWTSKLFGTGSCLAGRVAGFSLSGCGAALVGSGAGFAGGADVTGFSGAAVTE